MLNQVSLVEAAQLRDARKPSYKRHSHNSTILLYILKQMDPIIFTAW